MASREGAWGGIQGAARDRGSGAAEIARRAAESLAALPVGDLEPAVLALIRGHLSMAPLWRLGSEALAARNHGPAAVRFARALAEENRKVSAAAAGSIDDLVVVHSYSSTAVAVLVAAGARALCGRSDPGGEGAMTARRLSEAGIDARVVSDDEAIRRAGQGVQVLVGADAIGPAGVVNKLGTAALAEHAAGDCVVAAGTSKFLAADLPAPEPFERTPLRAFTAFVTDRGLLAPAEAGRLAATFPVHPRLREELMRAGGE